MICTRIIHVAFPYKKTVLIQLHRVKKTRFQQTLAAWQSMALHLLGVAVTKKNDGLPKAYQTK